MTTALDITGHRYGRLVALRPTDKRWHDTVVWECACDCGEICEVPVFKLRRGSKKSCGCLLREAHKANGARNRTHGLSDSPTHVVYRAMMGRCYRPDSNGYERYGGAGVTVCERWHKFANFVEDMGARPTGMTLDRIDNAKGYEPGNCRWATRTEQSRNRSISLFLEIQGETKCLSAWAEQSGVERSTISARLRRGWSVECAVNTPVRPRAGSSTYAPHEKGARYLDESGYPVKENN